jgi:hypothetical protein
MFFGMTNSPATFQSMMNDYFADYITQGWVLIYIDDILILSKNPEHHHERTMKVLTRLKEKDLFLKPEKCAFNVSEVEYLGFIVKPNEISMDPTKLAGIRDWIPPKNVKGVRSFLGFGNFYRRFIGNYAAIAKPMNELTKKTKVFEWSQECQTAFDNLKKKFLEKPVLVVPNPSEPFYVESDTSKWATGAVLRQRDTNGDLKPCSYISHSFTPTERNYDIYDRELLGIIRALETWRHFLEESPHPVTVFSDHKNLTYFKEARKLNRRQARWSLYLSRFNLHLFHVPGSRMIQSDALSRRPDHIPENDDDNENIVILPDKLFINLINVELAKLIESATTSDELVKDISNVLSTKGIPPIKSSLSDWKMEDGKLFYQNRCYIPNSEGIRKLIVQEIHDSPMTGHPGRDSTLEMIQRHYWWPRMRHFVNEYVTGCATCQQNKVNTHPTQPPTQPIKSTTKEPFKLISQDFISGLPKTKRGFDCIMVVVDHGLTKGVIFIPTNKELTALEAAELHFDHTFKRFGLPDDIISDRDPLFVSKTYRSLMKLCGVKQRISTAYHPQTDGETERVNRELETYLRIFCKRIPEDWDKNLSIAEFAYNGRPHSVTKRTPFYLMLGYEPTSIPTAFQKTNVPVIERRLAELLVTRDDALAAHELARQVQIKRSKKNSPPFSKGDLVWLDGRHLNRGHTFPKMSPLREGPFKIEEIMGPVTYKLKLPPQWKIHNVFHGKLLTPYRETDVHGKNFPEPPPDLIEGEDEYEVDSIRDHRKRGKGQQYLVKWKGYSDETWEPEANLKNASEILKDYKKRKRLQ